MSVYMDRADWSQKKTQEGFTSTTIFRKQNPVFLGHYPNNPIYPASLLVDFCYEQLCEYYQVSTPLELDCHLTKAVINKGIRPDDCVTFCFKKDSVLKKGKKHHVFDIQGDLDSRIARFEFSATREQAHSNEHVSFFESKSLSPSIQYLPQRYPLLVVDNISTEEKTENGYANKLVSYGDFIFSGVDNDREKIENLYYPFGAIIEGIEQSAGLILSEQWPVNDTKKEISIAGFSNIILHNYVRPGDVLHFNSKLEFQSSEHGILSGFASVEKKLVVSIDKIFVVIKPLENN